MTIIINIFSSIFSEHFVDLSFKTRKEKDFPVTFVLLLILVICSYINSDMHILIEYSYSWVVIVPLCSNSAMTIAHLCVCVLHELDKSKKDL